MAGEGGRLGPVGPRLDAVDFLRGVSILAVVLLHTWLRLYFNGYNARAGMPRVLARLLFSNGGNGVTVFFAVSGFLITLTSLRRFGTLAAMRPKVFYRIRFARIAPLLGIILLVLSALALLRVQGFTFARTNPPVWRAVLSAVTFHLNWLEARFGYLPANWDVLWSLSVEEMFYLFFPLLCVGLLRFRRGTVLLVGVLLGFVAMGPFARTVWTTNPVWQEKTYLGGMDGIALGCLTALLVQSLARREGWAARRGGLLAAVQYGGAGVIAVIACGPAWLWKIFPFKPDVYGSLLALGACMVMLGSVLRQRRGAGGAMSWVTAPVRWYGRRSYEVYLTHEFLVVWGVQLFLRRHPAPHHGMAAVQPGLVVFAAWFAGIVVLAGLVGWLVARFVSEPLNGWLRGARTAG